MSTFAGMTFFAGLVAIVFDKVFGSIVSGTSAAAEASRFAVFTGTWTAVGSAFWVRGIRNSARRFSGRAQKAQRLAGRTKDN